MLLTALALAGGLFGPQDGLSLDFESATPQWKYVTLVDDGAKGHAARFGAGGSVIDLGPCGADSTTPFTLRVALRTNEPGFCTPVMARDGEPVAFSLIMGREPGRVSFEAWSWGTVKLISRSRVDDGQWHTVEVAYEPKSNTALLSVDGRVEAAGKLGAGGCPTAKLRLGNNIGCEQPYNGDIDELTFERSVKNPERLAGLGPITSAAEKSHDLAEWREKLAPRKTSIPIDGVAWKRRQGEIREHVADALGLTPLPARGELDARIHGEITGNGVTVSRVTFNSWPGYRATAWMWQAEKPPEGKRPAMFMPHGHWAGGAIDPVVQVRAARFARAGYVVLVPDSVHVEDTATGVNAVGAMTWNNMRAIDYLVSRPDVDAKRIGITGASGGAQQTMYLMALEDRLAAAAPVCMISYYQEILDDHSAHCRCNHVPRIAAGLDQPEMCAAFAPKPVLFINVTGDWTHRFLEQGLPEIQQLYGFSGARNAVESQQFVSGHDYSAPMRARVYKFFDGLFSPPRVEANEEGFRAFSSEALLNLGPAPRAPDRSAMAAEYAVRRPRVEKLRELAPALPWDARGAKLTDLGAVASGSAWHGATVVGVDGVRVPVMARGVFGSEAGPITVVVSPGGRASLMLEPPAWLAAAGRAVIFEPRTQGEWGEFAGAWVRNGLLLGCGEGYLAAHDIAKVVESLPPDAAVQVVALGSCGVEALIAAGITTRIGMLVVEDLGPSYADGPDRSPQLPEIRRFGDVPAVVASVGPSCKVIVGGATKLGQVRDHVIAQPGRLSDAQFERALSR